MQESDRKVKVFRYSTDVYVGGSQDSIAVKPKEPELRQDGGKRAWLQVLGCWLLFMNTW
jgi:hypothetical protein